MESVRTSQWFVDAVKSQHGERKHGRWWHSHGVGDRFSVVRKGYNATGSSSLLHSRYVLTPGTVDRIIGGVATGALPGASNPMIETS